MNQPLSLSKIKDSLTWVTRPMPPETWGSLLERLGKNEADADPVSLVDVASCGDPFFALECVNMLPLSYKMSVDMLSLHILEMARPSFPEHSDEFDGILGALGLYLNDEINASQFQVRASTMLIRIHHRAEHYAGTGKYIPGQRRKSLLLSHAIAWFIMSTHSGDASNPSIIADCVTRLRPGDMKTGDAKTKVSEIVLNWARETNRRS